MITRLPIVHGAGVAGQSDSKARQVFDLMLTHPQQQRIGMVWDDHLAEIAQAKNMRQAHERWEGHTDPQGHGANWLARSMGYPLPDWYSTEDDANNIESLGRGGNDGDVMQMWQTWLNSPAHAAHVLGTLPFYAGQVNVGVAYYYLEGSVSLHYWCILSSHQVDIEH